MRRNTATDPWLTANSAKELSGLTDGALRRAAERGEVRTRVERGLTPLYCRADLMVLVGYLR